MFEFEINSGIPISEIISYFSDQASSMNLREKSFCGDGWEVRLVMLPDAIHHSIIIPRTAIRFTGEKESCEELIASYRKTFMRGGA